MKKWLTGLISLALMLVFTTAAHAQTDQWPRTVMMDDSLVTIYAPVIEEMKGNTIYYRAAIAYRETATAEPVFGAGWFESPVEIRNNGTVQPEVLLLTGTRFPDGTADISAELKPALAAQSLGWNLDFSREELDNALQLARAESQAAEKLNTRPPEIIYRDGPALLVNIDGEPVLRDIENSTYQAVINTPYPLIYDKRNYYLNVAKDVWYRSRNATGPYRFEPRPPRDIASMVENSEAEPEETIEKVTSANAPEIVVSTTPAELIVTEGPAAFVPLVDDLLVLENSDSDVFMHVGSQQYYIVLSGRWYHAKSLNGPWSWQDADDLPGAFANIPQNSDQAESRVYVAGTPEAREAVLDAHVPQTAAVERGVADIQVSYDGAPVYEPVDGTDMVYIRNTGSTVLKAEGVYYLVEDGVWYVSTSPNGPWRVSDYRPTEVDMILPTSPVYNSKYVYVYESTPEVVYVGYTPGYTGSYVYHNTIYYGTGWHYRPWVSPYYYYPRLRTWGFAVHYNPWYGWNFGLSWGWGPFSVGWYSGGYWHHHHHWHHRHYGYWGPRGYRPRHYDKRHYKRHDGKRYAYRDHRSNRDHYRRDGSSRRYDGRWNDSRYDRYERHDNLYRDSHQRGRIASTHDRKARNDERRKESLRLANQSRDNKAYRRSDRYAKKGEKNRTAPVSKSDLNRKAVVRDINRKDRRHGDLVADNNGKVYRNDRKNRGNARNDGRDLAYNSPVDRNKSPASRSKRNNGQDADRNRLGKNERSYSKTGNRQTTQPVRNRSSKTTDIKVTNERATRSYAARSERPTRTPQRSSTGRNTQLSSANTSRNKVSRQTTQPVKSRNYQSSKPQNKATYQARARTQAPVKRTSQRTAMPQHKASSPRTAAPGKATKSRSSHKVANRSGSKNSGNKKDRH